MMYHLFTEYNIHAGGIAFKYGKESGNISQGVHEDHAPQVS